jgi:hypothetical protein
VSISGYNSHSAPKYPYLIPTRDEIRFKAFVGFCEIYENSKNNMNAYSIQQIIN